MDGDVVRAFAYAVLLDRFDDVALVRFLSMLVGRVYEKVSETV